MNEQRARNALLGLVVGDALSWPAIFHRSYLLPAWPRRIRREMDQEGELHGILPVPMPFSLNQAAEAFNPGPTDDTEWAAWIMDKLITNEGLLAADMVESSWKQLADEQLPVRGWTSTHAALLNLRRGMKPPETGHDNPHYFDDGALCRAVPIGILYAGKPDVAVSATALEAAVTNAEDGVWVAQALAAAISVACAGGTIDDAVRAATDVLPKGSWSRRTVEDALRISAREEPVLSLVPSLLGIVNKEYSQCSGPETLALALVLASRCTFDSAVPLALAFSKNADALPAMVGALTGACDSGTPVPVQWEESVRSLGGICIPRLKGRDYVKLVDDFVALSRRISAGRS